MEKKRKCEISKCQVCKKEIEKKDMVRVKTEGLKGEKYFHTWCFDDVWETFNLVRDNMQYQKKEKGKKDE